MIFCTIFDSFYLDKGLALYRSLVRVSDSFKLYIYAFDDKVYNVLLCMELKRVILLRNKDLESAYPVLNELKKERSKAEYCWTCTPVSVEYILDHYKEEACTYIDSDLYFFADPQILFNEIREAGANIVITPHRFSNSLKGKRMQKRSGKYCVEFNYFDQSDNSRSALCWWKERCFEWCYHIYENDRMGDQKYLEKFPLFFKGVHELENLGGGVAPWNLSQYKYAEGNSVSLKLRELSTEKKFEIIFFHFQSMRYINENFIIIRSGTHSKKTKAAIYEPYLRELEKIRAELDTRYGITFNAIQAYASNPIIAFLQKYILRFKVKSLSDIYDLRKLRESNAEKVK